MNPCALKLAMSFRCTRADAALGIDSLSRADLRVRTTTCAGMVLDDGFVPRAAKTASRARMALIHVLAGAVVVRGDRPVTLSAGEALLTPRSLLDTLRFEHARFLEIDWEAGALEGPRRVAPVAGLSELADSLAVVEGDGDVQREYLARVLDVAARMGVTLPPSLVRFEGGPSGRDLRVAAALAEQFANIKHKATTLHFGEEASLSPRQLQRVLTSFNERYGVNAGRWRDVRNRWRLRLGLALLSLPALSVAEVADEIGMSGASSLARLFAQWQIPTPSALRAFVSPARHLASDRRHTVC